jgi:hypothetical protein
VSAPTLPPLPDFIVIGAQKAGTHWIRENLGAHPDVYVAPAELEFFIRPSWVRRHGADGYRRLFLGWDGEALLGEATPGYLVDWHGPERMARAMADLVPDVRPIAILRDPVERARSALVHHRRRGTKGVPMDGDLVTVLRGLGPPERDLLFLVTGGRYASSLRPYLDVFGDRLLVLLNDDLQADPGAAYDDLLAHIGLARGFRPPAVDARVFSYDGEAYGVPPLTAEERDEAFAYFAADVAELEVLLGRDLSAWREGIPPVPAAPAPPAPPRDREVHSTVPLGWTRALAMGNDTDAVVVQRSNGAVVVVEGDTVREVHSPIVGRALLHRFGGDEVTEADLRALLPGPPVVMVKVVGETPFVVVGGQRLNVPGMGNMLHTGDEWYDGLETGPPLDVLKAAEELQDERRRRP